MKRWIGVAALVAFSLICLSGTYVLGFRQGWHYGLLSDSVPQGALALGLVQGVTAGKTESVLLTLESQVDRGLLMASEIESGPGFALIDALSGRELALQQRDYLRRLAAYRKTTPSPIDYGNAATAIAGGAESELGRQTREAEVLLREMVERHAQ
jgi:hypothetical protein